MYKVSDLTLSERFALNKRRLGMTGTQYGKKYNHTKNQVSAWEQGKDLENIPKVVLHPKILPHESLFIARRRRNFGIHEMAEKMGVSHVTYVGYEKGRASDEAMKRPIRFWNGRGWPKKGRGE